MMTGQAEQEIVYFRKTRDFIRFAQPLMIWTIVIMLMMSLLMYISFLAGSSMTQARVLHDVMDEIVVDIAVVRARTDSLVRAMSDTTLYCKVTGICQSPPPIPTLRQLTPQGTK